MPKQQAFPPPFLYKAQEFEVYLRCTDPCLNPDRTMWVAIHTNSYAKTLPFLEALSTYLKIIIPFPYEMNGDPEVVTLAGPRFKYINSVQFNIQYNELNMVDVWGFMEKYGFRIGLENTL